MPLTLSLPSEYIPTASPQSCATAQRRSKSFTQTATVSEGADWQGRLHCSASTQIAHRAAALVESSFDLQSLYVYTNFMRSAQ